MKGCAFRQGEKGIWNELSSFKREGIDDGRTTRVMMWMRMNMQNERKILIFYSFIMAKENSTPSSTLNQTTFRSVDENIN